MSNQIRNLGFLDRVLSGIERALGTVCGAAVEARPSPAAGHAEIHLDDNDRKHVAGLMRVNHTGEVCAQALYDGQAAFARDPATRTHLQAAASEEADHLAWCAQRLHELDDRPSFLNPLWYAGSFGIGALAALFGDGTSLGFVVETERQVEAHLHEHLQRLPGNDGRSRAILETMQKEEAGHAANARARGGAELPSPIPSLMRSASSLMKAVAYRI
ncbi:MAG: 2-polyprenyl-3-methyl-6-methoxy-1,4-benzoquinone monooxygenase [Rhodanobacteraceae bacterium]